MKSDTIILECLKKEWILSIPKIVELSWCSDIDIYRSIGNLLEQNKIQELVKGKRKTSCFKVV